MVRSFIYHNTEASIIFWNFSPKITKYFMILGAPNLSNDQVTCWTCPHGFAKNETCLNYPEDTGRANTCRIGFHDHCRTLIIGIFRLIPTCAMVFSVWIKIFMYSDLYFLQYFRWSRSILALPSRMRSQGTHTPARLCWHYNHHWRRRRLCWTRMLLQRRSLQQSKMSHTSIFQLQLGLYFSLLVNDCVIEHQSSSQFKSHVILLQI